MRDKAVSADTRSTTRTCALVLALPLTAACGVLTVDPVAATTCDIHYPTICVSPPKPDLACRDIPHRRFRVIEPDPHHFDGDKDGVGCER